jgi:predicted secreted hydrolase
MLRRPFLLTPLALAGLPALALPPKQLAFPRDHGAHPEQRTEWWYITGHTDTGTAAKPRVLGYQITFFRSRVDAAQALNSRFAAKHIIFAHVAVTDVASGKHLHDQRMARQGFGVATASETTTDITLRGWTLQRDANGRYTSKITAKDFTLDLQFTPTQALLLQGAEGLSRKAPGQSHASYYYSQPQLAATGSIRLGSETLQLAKSAAWLDHEWSEALLHPEAVGWDWIGMNLFDGGSLMAFQLRRQDGSALWTDGVYRSNAQYGYKTFKAGREVAFSPKKYWTSSATGARYPVEWLVRTPADIYTVKALLSGQELDSRAGIGALYWEGLSDLYSSNGELVGRGYLEMTGYAGRLNLT